MEGIANRHKMCTRGENAVVMNESFYSHHVFVEKGQLCICDTKIGSLNISGNLNN